MYGFVSKNPFPQKVAYLYPEVEPSVNSYSSGVHVYGSYFRDVRAAVKDQKLQKVGISLPDKASIGRGLNIYYSYHLRGSADDYTHIVENIPRTYQLIGWGYHLRASGALAKDEEGRVFHLDGDYLVELALAGLIGEDGFITKKCVWGFNDRYRLLVPVDTSLYTKLVDAGLLRSTYARDERAAKAAIRLPRKDLVVGSVYLTLSGKAGTAETRHVYPSVYLGKIRKWGKNRAEHTLTVPLAYPRGEKRVRDRAYSEADLQDLYLRGIRHGDGKRPPYRISRDPVFMDLLGSVNPGIVYDPARACYSGAENMVQASEWVWDDVALAAASAPGRFSTVL